MRIWAGMAAAGAALLLRSAYERRHFTTERYEIVSEKIKKPKTLVFLSDLHDNCFGSGQKELLEAIDREQPDAVLIGGDMLVVKKKADTGTALFLAGKLAQRYPVYYGNGNHENRMNRDRVRYGDRYDRYIRTLKQWGVTCLSDASAFLGDDVRISAADLDTRYYQKFLHLSMKPEYLAGKLGKADGRRFQILLLHSPLYHKACAIWGADLTLSGHFHGGTIRLPVLGGVMTPQFQFFKRCCAGLRREGERVMIVSRGLGTHSVNIRINNRPELTVIHLRPAESGQERES